jgi:hypothetical protein
LKTGNTRALTINSSQNVGIGTTSPSSKLVVRTSTDHNFEVEEAGGELRLSALNNARSANIGLQFAASEFNFLTGNVGIGTDSPDTYNASAKNLVVYSTGNTGITIASNNTSSDGTIRFADGTGGTAGYRGSIQYSHNGDHMRFYTSATERLRINGSGNVGIGTTSPSQPFHVVGNIKTFGHIFLQSNANGFRTVALDTTDGADNQELYLCGGGTASSTRGGQVGVYGNEVSSTGGSVVIVAGNVSTGDIDFLTANTQRMIINNAGNVGIGTTSPGSYDGESDDLVVFNSTTPGITIATNDTASRGALRFADGTSGNERYRGAVEYNHDGDDMFFRTSSTIKMTLDTDGKVGIGTTSPSQDLHIKNDGDASVIFLERINNNAGYLLLNGSINPQIAFPHNQDLRFATVTNSAFDNFSEKMRINSSGNVGIGTTSPAARLHVENTNAAIVYVKSTVNNQNASIWFNSNSGGTQADRWEIGTNISAGTDLEFFDRLNSVSRMVIQNDGNVGIGTISPNEKLQVAGNIHAYAPSGIDAGLFASTAAGSTTIAIRSNGATHFNGGNVGIGVTSPSAKLDVFRTINITSDNDTGYVNSALILNSTESNARGAGVFMHNTNDDAEFYMGVPYAAGFDKWMVAFKSTTSHTDSTSEEANAKFIVESNGDVLIGGVSVQGARTVSFDVSTNGVVHDNCTTSGAGNGWEFQTFRRNNGSNSVQIGSIVMNGTSGITYATSSDYRLKENVVKLTNALDRIDQLKPSRFNFISDKGRTVDGFLAHEVQDIVPEAIVGTKDEVDEDDNPKYQSIDQSKIVPLLVAAIQELKAEIEILKNK